MKRSVYLFLAAGLMMIGGLSSCSSSNTETTDTSATTETVTTDAAAARPVSVDTAASPAAPTAASTAYDTTNFGMLAASSDMVEIRSSEQALTKATHPEVKKFAQQMITEHKKTAQELKSLSDSKRQQLPTTLLPGDQRMYNEFMVEEAKDFDESYMKLQVETHQETVELFEDAAKEHTDPDFRAYAAKHLPHLKMHLATAEKVKDLVD